MADAFYKGYTEQVVNGAHDWEYYDCYIMLLTDAYDPAGVSTQVNVSDVTAWEVADGGGYTQGGKLLVDGVAGWTVDAGQQTVSLTIPNDPEWLTSTITARYAVVYTAADAGSPPTASSAILMALLDFGQNETTTGGTFTVPFDPSGVVLQVNGEVGDVGYQYHVHRAFNAYPNPFDNSSKYIEVLDNTYTPDYENHNHDSSTVSALIDGFGPTVTSAIEGDDYVFRQDTGTYLFPNFTGTVRYVSMRRNTAGYLGTCVDLGADVPVAAANLVLNFPDGFMKFATIVETPQ